MSFLPSRTGKESLRSVSPWAVISMSESRTCSSVRFWQSARGPFLSFFTQVANPVMGLHGGLTNQRRASSSFIAAAACYVQYHARRCKYPFATERVFTPSCCYIKKLLMRGSCLSQDTDSYARTGNDVNPYMGATFRVPYFVSQPNILGDANFANFKSVP
jgi:hypothetical protein